jgi:thioredoxin 1
MIIKEVTKMAFELTDGNFGQEVLKSDIPVLVDFYADWCGPCTMMAPIVEDLSEDYKGVVKVGKVNVEEYPDLSSKYSVINIPTFLLFKDGQITETIVGGGMSKEDFKSKIEPYI